MWSKALFPALWLVATLVAATVAWFGLSLVGTSIDGEETVAIDVAGSSPVPSAGPTTTTTPRPTTGPDRSPATTADAPDPAGSIRTFDLVGGQVAIRIGPDVVEVVWATPAEGYVTETEAEDDGIEVTFDNGSWRSKVDAWWDGGPRSEIEEDDRSGSGGGGGSRDDEGDSDDDH